MTRNDAYTSNLRTIIFNSADVLPNEVINYLNQVKVSRSNAIKTKILKEAKIYRLLIDYIPDEFADLILDLLIKKPVIKQENISPEPPELSAKEIERIKTLKIPEAFGITEEEIPLLFRPISGSNDDDDDDDLFYKKNFGIEDYYEVFSPPAPIQGPFLYLLNKHEDKGLRLIQTLTNSAIKQWRKNKEKSSSQEQSLTPLPVIINLLSGEREFWGDDEVYCWYRGTVIAPDPVMSSLMALEFWMEKQIESGRNVEEIFDKVLSESDCVAVLGICVSLALGNQNKCLLKAILPIISSPGVWQMEIRRYVSDQTHTRIKSPLDSRSLVWNIVEQQAKKPQRELRVQDIVPLYIFSRDNSIRIAFEQAVSKFKDFLPFTYLEQQKDPSIVAELQETIEFYQAFCDRKNYQTIKIGEQSAIQYQAPEKLQRRKEQQLKYISDRFSCFTLYAWAETSIKEKKVSESMTLEEATNAANKLLENNDFSSTHEGESLLNNLCIKAIVGVAAAILVVDFEWAEKNDLVTWSSEILLHIALAIAGEDFHNDLPFSLQEFVGRGLGELVSRDVATSDVRNLILILLNNAEGEGLQGIFQGLYKAWLNDKILCWNAFTLGLSLCIFPKKVNREIYIKSNGIFDDTREKKWKNKLVCKHINNLERNHIPILPKITTSKQVFFLHQQVIVILNCLPLSKLTQDSDSKSKLIKLTEELISWTIEQNTPDPNERWNRNYPPSEWNYHFLLWLANLARFLDLDETRQRILNPIKNSWSVAPVLTANLMEGYVHHHIARINVPSTNSMDIWREICNWVLDTIKTSPRFDRYSDDGISEAVYLIIFVRFGSSLLKPEWPHITLFMDIIEKWIKVVGHNFYAYSCLLTMIEEIGWQFVPEPAIEWLNRCAKKSDRQLWQNSSNGERTAKLLQRMWSDRSQQINKNSKTLKRYSDLVDLLVDAGVPLASLLRQELEKKKSS